MWGQVGDHVLSLNTERAQRFTSPVESLNSTDLRERVWGQVGDHVLSLNTERAQRITITV